MTSGADPVEEGGHLGTAQFFVPPGGPAEPERSLRLHDVPVVDTRHRLELFGVAADHIRGDLLLGLVHDHSDDLAELHEACRRREEALDTRVLPGLVEGLDLLPHDGIDLVDLFPGHVGADAPVDEEHVVDHHRHRQRAKPFAVDTLGLPKPRCTQPSREGARPSMPVWRLRRWARPKSRGSF